MTALELVVTVALIGIAVMFVAPRFGSYQKTSETLSVNEKHKVVVTAIYSWVQDNKLNYQRPGDFEAENSQGRTVVDYLTDKELISKTNAAGDVFLEDEGCIVTFKKGILLTANAKDSGIASVYTVFEPEDSTLPPESISLKDFELLRGTNKETGETDGEYQLRIKNKDLKKLLLKEDNAL